MSHHRDVLAALDHPNGSVYPCPSGSVPHFALPPTLAAKPATLPTGRKDDSGKLDMTLFDDMPRALEAVAEVMQWAITKKQPVPYDRGSWLGVSPDRYRAAIGRHNNSACHQASMVLVGCTPPEPARFQKDAETKLLHLAHMACSALFALELTLREIESKKA